MKNYMVCMLQAIMCGVAAVFELWPVVIAVGLYCVLLAITEGRE